MLMPEPLIERGRPIQHLAGDASWEEVQHCLRCGNALTKRGLRSLRGMSMKLAHE